MTSPARMPSRDRETQVLGLAEAAFLEHGYDGVSMEVIARAAGVTKPIVYRRFGSKEGLFGACLRAMVEPMVAAVEGAVDRTAAPDRQLWAGIVRQLVYIGEHPDRWRRLYLEATVRGGPAGEAARDARRRVITMLAGLQEAILVTHGLPADLAAREARFHAHVLQGTVERAAEWWLAEAPDEPVESVAWRVMNVLWQGTGAMLRGEFWTP